MKQTFVLQEVIDDLIDTNKSLSAPLMKLNYFGLLTKNEELTNYTSQELNGYKNGSQNVPEYRRTIANLTIDMQAYMNRHTAQLPISMLEEPYKSSLKYIYIRDGIAAVEKLAKESQSEKTENEIVTQLPMEMLHILQEPARKLYKSDVRLDVVGARLSGNSNIVVEIPTAIRTKLLEFTMSIGETFGYDIEIESFNKKRETNNQTIIHQMSTTINNTGDGNLINAGNENQIENNVTLYKGNFDRLKAELEKQGIDQTDIQEIGEIIKSEQPNHDEKRLGEKANSWISNIINKSLNGVGKIATGVSANILATLVKQYYGF